jgi:hypothetical protein
MNRPARIAQYRAHLKSPQWAALRSRVMSRAKDRCEYCGEPAEQVHHVEYPKQFENDTEHNLIALCRSCHMRAHGMRAEKKTFEVVKIDGEQATFNYRQIDHAGEYWLSLDDVKYALESEQFLGRSKMAGASWALIERELEENPDEYFDCEIEDRGAYRVRRFVNELGVARVVWAYPNSESAKRARQHFRKLLKAERERRRGSLSAPAGDASVADVISRNLAPYFGHINHRIEQIEYAMPTMRNPDEFITAREGITEQGRDPSMLGPRGRRNLEEWVGAHLTQNKAETGPKRTIRLGGRAIDVSVNTYRRKEIYRAIDVAMSGLGGE